MSVREKNVPDVKKRLKEDRRVTYFRTTSNCFDFGILSVCYKTLQSLGVTYSLRNNLGM